MSSGGAGRTPLLALLFVAFVAGIVFFGPDNDASTAVRRAVGLAPDREFPAVDPPSPEGPHRFLQTTADGDPVGYDPCAPVVVQVNRARQPPGAGPVIARAVGEVAAATGLDLRMGADTDERPALGAVGEVESPPSRPRGPATVTIVWSGPRETPALRGRTVGVGGSTAYASRGTRPYYARGAVALDTRPLREALVRGGELRLTAVVEHELGHVVGLAHVRAQGELMNADNLGRLELGPGDRTGLALVGAIPCP